MLTYGKCIMRAVRAAQTKLKEAGCNQSMACFDGIIHSNGSSIDGTAELVQIRLPPLQSGRYKHRGVRSQRGLVLWRVSAGKNRMSAVLSVCC